MTYDIDTFIVSLWDLYKDFLVYFLVFYIFKFLIVIFLFFIKDIRAKI